MAYAEADSTLKLADTTTTLPTVAPSYPTNQKFGQQWGLNNPGNVDIDSPEAWSVTTGSRLTIVAVIDTGIDLDQPATGQPALGECRRVHAEAPRLRLELRGQ